MTVAIFINNISNGGGTEVVSIAYAMHLLEQGDEVHFVTMGFKGTPKELENTQMKIHSLQMDDKQVSLSSLQIDDAVNYCKKMKIERVVFVVNVPSTPVGNLNLILDIFHFSKVEVVFHSSPKSYLKRYWNSEHGVIGNLLRIAKTKFKIAPYARKFIKTLYKNNVKIFTLNHGCQREMKKYYGTQSEIRYNPYTFIELDLQRKKNIVTYCGRLAPEKNVFLLLKSWKVAKTNGWKLRLIGDGVQRNFLKKFCERNKLNNVEFLGSVPHTEIYSFMAESKVFCLTSFNEGFPTVVTEAMNMGNAIITTKFDGLSDELLNSENCIIAKANARRYSQALNKVLLNASLVTKMGEAAYERCKEFYFSKEYLEKID